ncbi:MAG: glycosyltransferase family 39 protein, partial [Deltaproteobacteria bacterium]|nr:glycosyltransferase family 39 protein [Deltaproteobacteria bacterium]
MTESPESNIAAPAATAASDTAAAPALPGVLVSPGATVLTDVPIQAGFFDRFSNAQMTVAVILFGLLLYVPFAGSYGLFDPWETHYGEVARQMTLRGDYISLWWPGAPLDAEHFWSKPVLSFWLMSLFMGLFGVTSGPAGALALGSRGEWAARVPFCLMGVLGLWAVYLCLSRFVGRRAGILGVIILGTSPMYALVSRQAMTDMAFVGPMTMALALGAL